MIRFALVCTDGHDFESWFPSGASFDAQLSRGLVTCPVCGSPKVAKQLMAPAVPRKGRSGAQAPAPDPTPAPSPPPPLALMGEREQAVRAMMRAVREHVTQNSDYVGPSFAAEARRMHHGEIEQRSIYGEASGADTKALLDEGIEIHPLPVLPDDRN